MNVFPDSINIKILNAGAWARGSERVQVSLPLELEDFIPEVEDFYRRKHSGRKLQWYHHMSNGTVRSLPVASQLLVPTFSMWNPKWHDTGDRNTFWGPNWFAWDLGTMNKWNFLHNWNTSSRPLRFYFKVFRCATLCKRLFPRSSWLCQSKHSLYFSISISVVCQYSVVCMVFWTVACLYYV